MRRDWDLIRCLLSAIDIDHDFGKRHRLIEKLARFKGCKSVNYHLCLLYEANLVRYYRPFYSEVNKQIISKPIQLTNEGIELLSLMKDDDTWKETKLLLTHGDSSSPNVLSASQNVLVSALGSIANSRPEQITRHQNG